MAQQAKKKSGKEGKPGESFKAEDVLQAIIIADSFNERFKPITLQTPRALLPIANCPTIEYTLEFLAGVGVQEILIFCRAHAEKIKNYIFSHGKWGTKNHRHRSVTVQVIVSEDCYSMGDALREIDSKNLIRGDFILVQGDLVANVDLIPALDAHRQRRVTDKNSVMTVVCRQVASRHPARSLEDQVVLTVEPANQRILHYQKTTSGKKVRFPTEILENRDDIEIRCDLLDCHISICSPQVPPLFADNFDYLTRDDFVRGILVSEEVLGNTIYCFVLREGYTARISNLHMYDVVSRDVIGRWVYPFCPDVGFPNGEAYLYKRHHIYQQKDVQLAMGSVLEENVILGRNSKVEKNSIIRNSVIGDDCFIGPNCTIDGAYIWDGCVVEGGCQIEKCIVAKGCFVGEGSKVQAGAILSYGVKIGPNAHVPMGTRLIAADDQKSLSDTADDFENNTNHSFHAKPADAAILGDNPSPAWTFELTVGEDSDADTDTPGQNFEESSWNWWTSPKMDEDVTDDSSEEEESDSEGGPTDPDDEDTPDGVQGGEGGEGGPTRRFNKKKNNFGPVEDARMFFYEISDSLMRAVEEHVSSENIILEINSSKFAYNVSMGELNKLLIRSILEIPEIRARHNLPHLKGVLSSAKEVYSEVQASLKSLLPVLRNYYRSTESQLDALFAIEECAVYYVDLMRHQPYGVYLHDSVMKIVKYLYDEDVLPEEVILQWYEKPSKEHVHFFLAFFLHETSAYAAVTQSRRRHYSGDLSEEDVGVLVKKIDVLKGKMQPLIKWLQEAEEESE